MHNLRNYGKILMEAEPGKTTELLKLLCTDYKSSDSKFPNNSLSFKLFFLMVEYFYVKLIILIV
jgi:hypothetical protein